MTIINNIDRSTHRYVQERIEKALKDLGNELGLDLNSGAGTYGGNTATFKISANVRTTASGMSGAEVEWRRFANWNDIDPESFGKTFAFSGETYKVEGWRPKAPVYPVLARSVKTGKLICFQKETVQNAFPKKAA